MTNRDNWPSDELRQQLASWTKYPVKIMIEKLCSSMACVLRILNIHLAPRLSGTKFAIYFSNYVSPLFVCFDLGFKKVFH